MGKGKIILGLAALALAVIGGWQIVSCELANLALREDLRDIASQAGAYIGLVSFNSDEDFRNAVIRAAKGHEIELEAEQVTVQRTGTAPNQSIYLAVDYKARVRLPGFSLALHFHPSSAK
jgi:hypothetical protein